ncbi:glycosyltransferase family 4 protein [Segetibacter koreensis]|uniref:glycosyltransferase family 4 protein n=1 Tax=Segetibacter koreensis TaxID=398037 RepID=UPI0004761BD9|nr:glycosyltransferase family 4 protein [Segetibacter koreensis]
MNRTRRLAVITTHPIQYNAPLFRLTNQENGSFTIKVFYTQSQLEEKVHDPDFGFSFAWDIPLTEGYEFAFVKNVSSNPGTRHFNGIINPTLIDEIEKWKADAVLVIGWSFKSHLKVLRYFHGKIPVLFRGDSNLIDEPQGFSIQKLLRRLFLRWVYHYVDYALYVGEANKQYYQVHGLKKEQLLFAPHAIDNNRFSGNDKEYDCKAAAWRSELGIKETDCVFLFAGKLTSKKDPEILIKAFVALNQKDTALIMVGNGALEAELKERYKLHANIFFIPFQNQSGMPVVYRLGDIFVLPSKGPGETWGLAVNEAMACSRGVIVSDKCGCVQDLVQTGVNGYVFGSGDINSLQSCLHLSLKDYKLLGDNSFQILQNHTYSAIIQQLNRLFRKNEVHAAG